MGPANCAVVGCTNNSRKLDKWKKSLCEMHPGSLKEACPCNASPPFRLYCFPGSKRYKDKLDKWIKLLKRQNADKSSWKPCASDRVCSEHFVDQIPTVENPDPTINLGYEIYVPSSRRELFRHAVPHKKRKIDQENQPACSSSITTPQFVRSTIVPVSSQQQPSFTPIVSDHSYCKESEDQQCPACCDKNNLIKSLTKQLAAVNLENDKLKKKKLRKIPDSPFTWRKIKSDAKMNFYTGISNIIVFHVIFDLIKPYLSTVQYWRGAKKYIRSTSKVKRHFSRFNQRKISQKDEFLLTLIRLRLGLLNEDLADRFNISPTICSNTFKTWVRLLNYTLGNALVKWLPSECIREHLPNIYKLKGHHNLRCIIDCSEVFIERPKSLQLQASTWSDYRSHNTFKFLIGISPTGYITFLSDSYGGRASDKFICNDSGFFELLERGDEIMADRGFQIKEELMLRFCHLSVPPGARVKAQMTTAECNKTKKIANLRIHVERAINRIKTYRILKTTLPITMLHHADDIIRVCAALCNLKPQLIASCNNSA